MQKPKDLYPDWYPDQLLIKKSDALQRLWVRISQPMGLNTFVAYMAMLIVFGWVMVYSASVAVSPLGPMGLTLIAIKQLAYIAMGVVLALVVYQVPISWFRASAIPLMMIGLVLLAAVLLPGVGREVNGAQRWIDLKVFNLQPVELVKLAVILYCADYCVRRQLRIRTSAIKSFIPLLIVLLSLAFLLLMQPDFGSLVVISVCLVGVLVLGGMNWWLFGGMIITLGTSAAALIYSSPYRMARFTAYLDPWADPLGKGYQLSHSLMAFGRGGFWGEGLGASLEKLNYLPEAHTDFILAVIGEELGFVGFALLMLCFAYLVFHLLRLGRACLKADLPFQGLVAQGFAIWIGFQASMNAAVCVGLVPTKGLTLPFISYGGSSLITNLVVVGLILRIMKELHIKQSQSNKEVFEVSAQTWSELKKENHERIKKYFNSKHQSQS